VESIWSIYTAIEYRNHIPLVVLNKVLHEKKRLSRMKEIIRNTLVDEF
jgi:hypothetical protein